MTRKLTYEELDQRVQELEKDESERRRAENLLLGEKEFTDKALDAQMDTFFLFEPRTGKALRWNRSFRVITGYTDEEIRRMPAPESYYSPEDLEKARIFIQKVLFDGTGEIELELICKNGKKVPTEYRVSVIKDQQGKPAYIISIGRDITERKRAEQALRESEAKHKTLVNNIPGMVYRAFPDWSAEVVSDSEEICGYTKEELASRDHNWLSMIHPEDKEKVFKYGSEMVKAKKDIVQTYRIRTKGGYVRWVEDRKSSIFSEEGKFLWIDGVIFDITDRKQAEEEKRRALELAGEQRKHAFIGQIAGKMAHDFNNVLMGIMGNAQLATLNCKDGKIREKLEHIVELSGRGRDITGNLMSFSKDQEPKQTYFKVEDKIELVLKMFEKDLAGIKVSRNYSSGIPELLADPGMIQDVLVNLVQNSIHAMSKVESPLLNIKAYCRDQTVFFEIEDNGCGIPEEHQESIYTPSFTLKGTQDKNGFYKPEIKGTGYGMSNVKKYIIDKHKGDIFLESEVGKGTKITIALKVIGDELSSDEKKEIVKNKVHNRKRILLVEDEPAIADVQYQILTGDPFRHIVSMAVNGQAAIDLFNRNKFDMVSLDYMLPGNVNGLDVYNHIRKRNRDIPVMFISGNIDFLESMKRLKEKDPKLEHLSKPVNNLEYVNKVDQMIGMNVKSH